MAQLAVAAIGAAIGGAIAPGVVALGMTGAAIGWMAGSVVGALVFAPDAPDGPRITDKGVRVGSYGRMIPITAGTIRVEADPIWCSDLIESSDEVGGKGGGGATVYSYGINLLVQVCESPQGTPCTPLRIWANGRLIWTNDGTPEGQPDTSLIGAEGIRWYDGQEGQLPDPVYEAAVIDAPAHLGTLTIMFEGLNLTFSAFRPPTIEVEVSRADAQSTQANIYVAEVWHGVGETTTVRAAGYLVMLRQSASAPQTSLRFVRDADGELTGSVDVPLAFGNPVSAYVDPTNGRTWVHQRSFADSTFYVYDPDGTLVLGPVVVAGVTAVDWHFTPAGQLWGRGLYPESLILMDELGGTGVWYPSMQLAEGAAIIGAASGSVLVWNGTTIYRYAYGAEFAAYIPDDLTPHFDSVKRVWYDEVANELIVVGAIDGAGHVGRVSVGDNELLGLQPLSAHFYDVADVDGALSLDTRRHYLWRPTTEAVSGVNYISGVETIGLYEYTPHAGASSHIALPSATGGALHLAWNDETFGDFYYARLGAGVGGQPIGLGALVSMVCERSGIDPFSIDVSELTDEVAGHSVTTRTNGRAIIDQLRAAYFFDAVESGSLLAFRKRGAAPVATIELGEMGAHELRVTESEVPPARKAEFIPDTEAPRELNVTYIDAASDYDTGLATARRQASGAVAPASIELPIALSAEEAGAIAWANLLYAHAARNPIAIALTHKYAALEPNDAILIPFADGELRRMRIDRRVDARPLLELEGVIEDISWLDVRYVGTPRSSTPRQSEPEALAATAFEVLDLPPLEPVDDELVVYVAVAPEA